MANPALGIRISPIHVGRELQSLDPRTFAVERLGVGDWPATGASASVINLERWAELINQASRIDGQVTLAFDVRPDRSASSIAAAGARLDGASHVEVVERRRGAGWVVERLLELRQHHDVASIVCDASGPAGSLVPELEEAGVEVLASSARDLANACGLFYDAVENGTLRHLGTPELLGALKGADQRSLGDAWAWSRKNSAVDICPLVASTLALWASLTVRTPEAFVMAW